MISSRTLSFALLAGAGLVAAAPQFGASTFQPTPTFSDSFPSGSAFPTDIGDCPAFPQPSGFFPGQPTIGWPADGSIYFPPVQTVTVTVYDGCDGAVPTAFPSGFLPSAASSFILTGSGAPQFTGFPSEDDFAPLEGEDWDGAVPSGSASGFPGFPGPSGSGSAFPGFPEPSGSGIGFPEPSGSGIGFPEPSGFPGFPGSPVACYCYPVDVPSHCGYPTVSSVPFPSASASGSGFDDPFAPEETN